MGYEILGTAVFGAVFFWLSTQMTIFEDTWRVFFFGFGFVNAILMFGLAAAPNAIIIKAIGALIYLLIMVYILFMYAFTSVANLWVGTR